MTSIYPDESVWNSRVGWILLSPVYFRTSPKDYWIVKNEQIQEAGSEAVSANSVFNSYLYLIYRRSTDYHIYGEANGLQWGVRKDNTRQALINQQYIEIFQSIVEFALPPR